MADVTHRDTHARALGRTLWMEVLVSDSSHNSNWIMLDDEISEDSVPTERYARDDEATEIRWPGAILVPSSMVSSRTPAPPYDEARAALVGVFLSGVVFGLGAVVVLALS